MQLAKLLQFNQITVQCHDNPDADAIASGFGLYSFFKSQGKNVRFIYSGRSEINKANLMLMLKNLGIDSIIEYVPKTGDDIKLEGLLITVDCQYGCGNVTKFEADQIAVIDHHQLEIKEDEWCEINPRLGSCSTLVWSMMKNASYTFDDINLGTALYYGLFTDTNSLTELSNPLDMDLRDDIICDQSLINMFKNSNLSLEELEIAGVALIKYIFNEEHNYAIIKAAQCDPNILGLISDFLIQVAEVYTCVVYNEWPDGFKYSVRSCTKEVMADEMAAFIGDGIGSGGGHREKAGGFIKKSLYHDKYPTLHTEAFFSTRINEYFDGCEVYYAKDTILDTSDMALYVKKKIPFGFVKASDILPIGTPVTVRTLEGDLDIEVKDDTIIMIGMRGEVYPSYQDKFEKSYTVTGEKYKENDDGQKIYYRPTIKNRATGETLKLTDYAMQCISSGGTKIYAKQMYKRMKVFASWDNEKYMHGKSGDYIAVRTDDEHDIYIIDHDIFNESYSKCD
ncbi:MAG: DHH family phosphoesterase [Lachnospiraceae bacterium]|nr:DHH family phosphoesterase [Lachnospiraceae bacterium]